MAQIDRFAAWEEVVRRAVGFIDAEDLKIPRGQHAPHELDGTGRKLQAHRSYAPFQIILRCTLKAIMREDDLAGLRYQNLHDLQQFVAIQGAEVNEWENLGMQLWHRLYERRGEPPPRWVLGIEYITDSQDIATERLYVFDTRAQVQNRISPAKWRQAKPGWNKRNNAIVLLLDPVAIIERFHTGRRHAFRFGPMLTAFLAACSPGAPNRFLVMKWVVRELQLFEMEPQVFQNPRHQEAFREWYAFHTLRRMYRMRWGVSLFDAPEQSGPLDQIRMTQDVGYQKYKEGCKKAWLVVEKGVQLGWQSMKRLRLEEKRRLLGRL